MRMDLKCSSSRKRFRRPESEVLETEDRPMDVPSSPNSATHVNEKEEIVVTSIRATDLALGLGRIPAGFHAVVHHNDLECKTENKPVSVNDDVIEWLGPIPIPFDLAATVSFTIHASFEFQPVLGDGEQLRKITITLNELLNHSKKDIPFTFVPKDGDAVSPCSSLSVTVKRQKCESNNPSGSGIFSSTKESGGQLEDMTNQGHSALSRYRKHGQKEDLERATEYFDHALNICPKNHPRRAAAESNAATAKFIHCQVYDADTSLDIPLMLYRNALEIRPVGHPDRTSTLIQLAAVHLARLEKRQVEVDRAQAGALLQEVMTLSSAASHEQQAAIFMLQRHIERATGEIQTGGQSSTEQDSTLPLTNVDPWEFSMQLLRRFEKQRDLANLQQAISVLEAFVRSIPPSDRQYFAALRNLGVALSYRFDRLGNLSDLEQAISRQRGAVDLAPNGHPDKPEYLNSLGTSFLTRFVRLGEISDLEEAILRQGGAVKLTPNGHPDKPGRLNNLGISFRIRFEHLGEISDLEEAISMAHDAVNHTPNGHPVKPAVLNNLGVSLRTRFDRLGNLTDFEQAISKQQDAVDLTPNGHPEKPGRLNSLAGSFLTRFECIGEISDLEEAISRQRDAVNLTPNGQPVKPKRLNNLGNCLLTRFERLGEISNLEEAISRQQDAVNLTPNGHPDRAAMLSNLGVSFRTRFDRIGNLTDLEEAISRQQDAVNLTPNGHPDKPGRLNNLGGSLQVRFERLGVVRDLEEGVARQQDAVALTPNGHPDMPVHLTNIGTSLRMRFLHLREIGDLSQAISRQRDAVDLSPDGHSGKPGHLNSLAGSLLARFGHLGEISDLEVAISRLQHAIDLIPNGHPDKSAYLNNLGGSFRTRFEQLGEISDLEAAILKQQDAVNLTPNGHPDKPVRLTNLSISFRIRFERLGEISDLEAAISRAHEAVDLTPDGHPGKPDHLSNLANCFLNRFDCLGELSDLEGAITWQQDAVNLAPNGHPCNPGHLSSLGIFFKIRFDCLGEVSDLQEAISKQQDAVDLTPNGHPVKPVCLNNLGNSFKARFERLGEADDLEEAISRQQDAVDATPNAHADKPLYLSNLGKSFLTGFLRTGEIGFLEQAILPLSRAAFASAGSVAVRFRASQQWINCARLLRHESLLHAYSVAINLLPQLAWIGLSLAHRYRELVQAADVVRDAAAAALDSGFPERAVEWLEQGRSVVWGELLQLRGSYDELASAHPDHARRLRALSAALEHAGSARERAFSERMDRATESLQQEADKHRTLAIQRDKLLQDIRRLPGFERFLLHKGFSELRSSAHSGPVVILNASKIRCDALIVLANVDHVIHVPLPNFTLDRSKQLGTSLKQFIRDARDVTDRYGYPIEEADARATQWKVVLSSLWKCVVKPVLDALAFSAPGDLSRIFWCQTGPFTFLPIHATGFYDDARNLVAGHKVSDFVMSSYIPSLSILAATSKSNIASSNIFRLLAVGQPPSDGQFQLPGVVVELEHIRTLIRDSPSARTTLVESSLGTVEEVLALLKEADWAHFACHGIQDDSNPTSSGLCLANERRLRISDVIALSRPRGGLAFLSACQTAKGDKILSDEAIHIAAGMLFAGYGGVIGTMWSINDKIAPDVAKDTYERLFHQNENGTGIPDYREAARALHVAVGRLRENKVLFEHWVPFIHMGL